MKIHPEVITALEGAHADGPLLRLPHQLGAGVDQVLRTTGGRWDGNRHVRAHRFDQPAHLDMGPGDRVLEPSDGTGAHIQPLPDDAFAVSGVKVRTVLIGLTTPEK